jgi:hypothetical protein
MRHKQKGNRQTCEGGKENPVEWCGVTVNKRMVLNVTPTTLFQPSYTQCCFQPCQYFLINSGLLTKKRLYWISATFCIHHKCNIFGILLYVWQNISNSSKLHEKHQHSIRNLICKLPPCLCLIYNYATIIQWFSTCSSRREFDMHTTILSVSSIMLVP